MEDVNSPFAGIVKDFKGRKACYKEDWTAAFDSGPRYLVLFQLFSIVSSIRIATVDVILQSDYYRILAPTLYIFFASAIPVIAFGEQLNRETGRSRVLDLDHLILSICCYRCCFFVFLHIDGSLSTVETLASTALCGIIHSIIGGQPLLIVGVAEPTVMMYTYMYSFAKGRDDLPKKHFLGWTGWLDYILKPLSVTKQLFEYRCN